MYPPILCSEHRMGLYYCLQKQNVHFTNSLIHETKPTRPSHFIARGGNNKKSEIALFNEQTISRFIVIT